MKTDRLTQNNHSIRFLIWIPVIILALMIFRNEASAQEPVKTDKKTLPAPPPPPPPPPVPVSADKQAAGIKDGDAYQTVDQMPVYPGGDEGLLKYVIENVKYPKEAKEKGIQGLVLIRFIVKEDGNVSESSVLKSVDPLLDNEALRVVRSLGKFTPGKIKGKDVPVWYILPVTFALK